MERESVKALRFTLHLLDSARGQRVQTWQFENRSRITIGRAAENDISLADAQVSRLHAELIHEGGQWQLICHGRNGVRVDGAKVTEFVMEHDSVFQLGSSGPTFQFLSTEENTTGPATAAGLATVDDIEFDTFDFLSIDEDLTEEEVRKIVDGDAFQDIQRQAERLRKNEEPDNTVS